MSQTRRTTYSRVSDLWINLRVNPVLGIYFCFSFSCSYWTPGFVIHLRCILQCESSRLCLARMLSQSRRRCCDVRTSRGLKGDTRQPWNSPLSAPTFSGSQSTSCLKSVNDSSCFLTDYIRLLCLVLSSFFFFFLKLCYFLVYTIINWSDVIFQQGLGWLQ